MLHPLQSVPRKMENAIFAGTVCTTTPLLLLIFAASLPQLNYYCSKYCDRILSLIRFCMRQQLISWQVYVVFIVMILFLLQESLRPDLINSNLNRTNSSSGDLNRVSYNDLCFPKTSNYGSMKKKSRPHLNNVNHHQAYPGPRRHIYVQQHD